MAGDKQFTGGTTKFKGKTKIYKLSPAGCANFLSEKVFVGFSGKADSIGDAIWWLNNPTEKMPKVRDIEALMLTAEGVISCTTTLRNWLVIDAPYCAIGSGASFAMSAMEMGMTPIEAVRHASKFDVGTGMGFNKLDM